MGAEESAERVRQPQPPATAKASNELVTKVQHLPIHAEQQQRNVAGMGSSHVLSLFGATAQSRITQDAFRLLIGLPTALSNLVFCYLAGSDSATLTASDLERLYLTFVKQESVVCCFSQFVALCATQQTKDDAGAIMRSAMCHAAMVSFFLHDAASSSLSDDELSVIRRTVESLCQPSSAIAGSTSPSPQFSSATDQASNVLCYHFPSLAVPFIAFLQRKLVPPELQRPEQPQSDTCPARFALSAEFPLLRLVSYTLPHLSDDDDSALLLRPLEQFLLQMTLPIPDQPSISPFWRLLFSRRRDGSSVTRFAAAAAGYRFPTILLVREKGGAVFGAYVACPWSPSTSFGGSQTDCYLFTCAPAVSSCRPSGIGKNFFYFNDGTGRNVQKTSAAFKSDAGIGFGGQLGFFRLWIDGDFTTGKTLKSESTYAGPFFAQPEFEIDEVALVGLGGAHADAQQKASQARQARFIEQRRKVDRRMLAENWADNPDKALLDWAGVHTSHDHENARMDQMSK